MQLVDAPIDDGFYDAFVVWAAPRDDGDVVLDLTITSAVRKGEVVHVRARVRRDSMELVGVACASRAGRHPPRGVVSSRTKPGPGDAPKEASAGGG
jgi:hypothetical protein